MQLTSVSAAARHLGDKSRSHLYKLMNDGWIEEWSGFFILLQPSVYGDACFAIYEPIAGLAVALLLRIAFDQSDVAVVGCTLCSV